MNPTARCALFSAIVAAAVLSAHPVMAEGDGACPADGEPKRVEYTATPATKYTGCIDSIPYLIYIPNGWQRGGPLIMNMYGYWPTVIPVSVLFARYDLIAAAWLPLGYAVAVSQSQPGWLPRERIKDTERLRQYFIQKFGENDHPFPSVISGFSMGGMQAYHVIETNPNYDGALAMCGFAMPSLAYLQTYVLSTRLLFDFYFPGVLNGSATEFPDGDQTMANACTKLRRYIPAGLTNPFCAPAAGSAPQRRLDPGRVAAYLQATSTPTAEHLPTKVAVHTEVLRELKNRYGGSIFDNANEIYPGPVGINRFIPRYSATASFDQEIEITGKVSKPVLALHTSVDDLVPVETTSYYRHLTDQQGTTQNFVQLYANNSGHCYFPEQWQPALKLLDNWIQKGARPTPGELPAPLP